jgi:hypothetical protein
MFLIRNQVVLVRYAGVNAQPAVHLAVHSITIYALVEFSKSTPSWTKANRIYSIHENRFYEKNEKRAMLLFI